MSVTTETASTVTSFLDSVGINANVNSSTEGSIVAQLDYLGLDQVRVEAPTSAAAATAFAMVGAAGIKFDMITTTFDLPISQTMLNTMFSYINTDAAYVESVEGPNEVQNDPDTYEGLSGAAAFQALQQTLYTMVKADALLTNPTEVLSFSNTPGQTPTGYTSPLAYTDEANFHAYGQPGVLPYSVIDPTLAVTTIATGKPIVLTETGETTVATSQGVSQLQQALYDTDAFLDGYSLGISKTYLFNLQDFNSSSTDTDFSGYYGLYNNTGVIKLAGTAIHDLTSILADPTATSSQIAGSLAYSLTGLPADGHTLLLEKSSGVFDLAIWAEDNSLYNTSTGSLNAVTTSDLTLSFGSADYDVSVYDPIKGSTATETANGVSSLSLKLGADPLIVQVSPTVTVSPAVIPALSVGSGPDELVLDVSEDAYLGNAEFTVSVDGTQVGGTLTASASHSLGQEQVVDVLGTFTAGTHLASVDFLNDLYAPGVGDRNLYVDRASIDGTVVSGGSLTLLSSGTKSLSFIAATDPVLATIGSGPDTLALKISEDAFDGNAEFTVSINGSQVGGTLTAAASHALGADQTIDVLGSFTAVTDQTVSVDFLNDLYSPGVGDRNLYVDGASVNGTAVAASSRTLLSSGSKSIEFVSASQLPTLSVGTGSLALSLGISGEAFAGNPLFTVSIDGKQVGGTLTASADHALGQSQVVDVLGALTAGSHTLRLDFLNDLYMPGVGDRNLYLDNASGANVSFSSSHDFMTLLSTGSETTHFTVT